MEDDPIKMGKIWELAQQAMRALGAQYNPSMEEAAFQVGLAAPAWYSWLLPALAFEPEALSTARLRVRSPYVAPRLYEERLANAAAGSYLRCVDQDGYVLTPKGRQAAQAVLQAAYGGMARLAPLEIERLEELARLLLRLVEASLKTPEPPGRWCLAHSLKIDPGSGLPVVARIDQYLSDLSAYRDDCHLAAWAPLGIDGPALEALTYLWRANVPLSLDELFETLKRRGWNKTDYHERLGELNRRGWVEQTADAFTVTLHGWKVRQEVEGKTDLYFYRPWMCLNPAELRELKDLLAAMAGTP